MELLEGDQDGREVPGWKGRFWKRPQPQLSRRRSSSRADVRNAPKRCPEKRPDDLTSGQRGPSVPRKPWGFQGRNPLCWAPGQDPATGEGLEPVFPESGTCLSTRELSPAGFSHHPQSG